MIGPLGQGSRVDLMAAFFRLPAVTQLVGAMASTADAHARTLSRDGLIAVILTSRQQHHQEVAA